MTSRTFKQYGQGYGNTSVTITVKLDSQTVFSGPVETIDQETPWKAHGVELCSFVGPDVSFNGTLPLEISVANGDLLLSETLANYSNVYITDAQGNVNTYSSGSDEFAMFYQTTIDGVTYSDPFTDEKIDGVLQDGPPNPEYTGQWGWVIRNGSTFTATLNIQPGIESPLVPPTAS
jgi:hypothetical protein